MALPMLLMMSSQADASHTNLLPGDSSKVYVIYFDFNSFTINQQATETLQSIKRFYDTNHVVRIEISGHTDAAGSDAYNMELSRRRAYAARAYLKDVGVNKDLLVEIYGLRKPAHSNESEIGRKMNRRAEIRVFYRDPKMISYRLHGVVMDATDGRPIPAEITVVGYRPDTAFIKTTDGLFDLRLNEPKTIILTCFAEGFLFQTRQVPSDTFDLAARNEIAVHFLLRRIEKGLKFDLRNIYFEGNKAVILPQSWPELLTLTKLMTENPTLTIEIRGHVNWPSTYPQPITFFAVSLAEERAKTVHDFLIYNSVARPRMSFKGMGNLEMIYPHTDQEPEMVLNRRVEVVVVDY